MELIFSKSQGDSQQRFENNSVNFNIFVYYDFCILMTLILMYCYYYTYKNTTIQYKGSLKKC